MQTKDSKSNTYKGMLLSWITNMDEVRDQEILRVLYTIVAIYNKKNKSKK